MPKKSRASHPKGSPKKHTSHVGTSDGRVSSEEAIRAGEQIAMAAFSSGLKLAAAFGTVAAKTAGLALASLASGADKFSELVKEEALRSNNGTIDMTPSPKTARTRRASARKQRRL